MNHVPDRRCVPFRAAHDTTAPDLPRVSRRLLMVALPLAIAACETGPAPNRVSPDGQRLARWLREEGRDSVLDPAAPRIMGMDNGQRDIPVKQLAENTPNGRLVVSLVNLRGRTEFIFHRRQGDYLYFHLADGTLFRRASATYPRQGAPSRMTESFAVADFPAQTSYWLEQATRRGRT